MTDDAARQAQARLDAWRERGGEQADPLRFHYLQALARRAAGHTQPMSKVDASHHETELCQPAGPKAADAWARSALRSFGAS
ncbi:DUF2894 domain-containing protein, partial [Bordetella bronchiseptica]